MCVVGSLLMHHANTQVQHKKLLIIKSVREYLTTIEKDSCQKMVDLSFWVTQIKFNWVYATPKNFTQQVLYKKPVAFLRLDAAKALKKVAEELAEKNLGLLIFDAYRPYSVTKKMWEVVQDERYTANPLKGSGHNRGAAVDVTLYNLLTGEPLAMPTDFDNFSEKAHHNYNNLPNEILANRELLKSTMLKYGFLALDTEWWHYYLPNAAEKFAILDLSFQQLKSVSIY